MPGIILAAGMGSRWKKFANNIYKVKKEGNVEKMRWVNVCLRTHL